MSRAASKKKRKKKPDQNTMSEGTPLDALETGDISNAADSAKMAEIMRDINASGGGGEMPMPAATSAGPSMMVSAPPMRPMPPMMQMHQAPHHAGNYTEVEEHDYKPRKKNMWSNITSRLRDPLIVMILVFVLSLPMLHTQLAKYASWAFAVGGQLSWFGLIAMSLLAGVLFAGIQGVGDLAGF